MRLAALVLLAVVALASPAAGEGRAPCPLIWGVALDGYPVGAESIARAAAETGLKPRLVVFFLQWPAPGQPGRFPLASLRAIERAGALPCLTWEPMHLDAQGREVTAAEADILGGRYDAYLSDFARQAAAWGKPLIVRLGHEMNLARYHWGTARDAYGPDSPAVYKRIYRHVVDLCRREGAHNLRWAFCPNAESNPHPRWHGAAWNTAKAYYPGDAYVDILGMDGYNWGLTQTKAKQGWDSRWLSFADTFGDLQAELKALAPAKPLVVFETSTAAPGGNRAQWVAEALGDIARWGVYALVWFQADKEIDWRLLKGRDDRALSEIARALARRPGATLSLLAGTAQAGARDLR